MKLVNKFLVTLSLALLVCSAAGAYAQTPQTTPAADVTRTRERVVAKNPQLQPKNDAKILDSSPDALATRAKSVGTGKSVQSSVVGDEQQKPAVDADGSLPTDAADAAQTGRHEQASEEAAIVPYYNNFFNTYRIGPEDIISVNVFGQDRYSRSAITVPPSGRISLALIPGGIFVNGKTVEEVAQTITKRYDEYIIDPQVSVSLDKASSYRYSVVGDVAQPGIRLMNRRLTVTEALSEAGGVLTTGDRSKVVVLRRQANGVLEPITVNVSAIYKGKAPDITYLVPGDQILVPGNKLKSFQKFDSAAMALEEVASLVDGKVTPMLAKLLDSIKDEKKASLAVADPKLGQAINKLPSVTLTPVSDNASNELFRAIRDNLPALIPGLLPENISTMSLGLSHSLSRHKLKFSPDKVDTMIVQAIALLDDLDKELNTYAMRVKEWYGWHFPEMARIINDNLAIARAAFE